MLNFFLTEVQITHMSMAEIDECIAEIDAELDGWKQQGTPETPLWFNMALANRMLLTEAWAERTIEY